MNVNGVGRQSYFEKADKAAANRKNSGTGFYESLSENINDRAGAEQKKESATVSKGHVAGAGYPYHNVASAAGRYESDRVNAGAVLEREAEKISYQESDYVKVYAEQGFTLMAQVNMEKRLVYIERKQEDGTVKGYEVNVDKLDKNTSDPIERTALEAWEQKAEAADGEDDTLTVEEALLQFYEFIEDRIKNGPPKFLIGASKLSVAEWDKLLESVDGQIDDIKEQMRERIEKLKEQQLKAELAGEQQAQEIAKKDADSEQIEEELLMSLFQEKGL